MPPARRAMRMQGWHKTGAIGVGEAGRPADRRAQTTRELLRPPIAGAGLGLFAEALRPVRPGPREGRGARATAQARRSATCLKASVPATRREREAGPPTFRKEPDQERRGPRCWSARDAPTVPAPYTRACP